MNFADQYLSKQQVFFHSDFENPADTLGCCIIIPCYNEDNLSVTLNSLWNCKRPVWKTEVFIVVNSSQSDAVEVKNKNQVTIQEFELWKKFHQDPNLEFCLIHIPDLPKKHAGAGLARKTGMDIAVSRFNRINRTDGIIISLDADCTCSDNYLTETEAIFIKHKPDCGIYYFEHPLTGQEFEKEVYEAIIQYELHLRYHIEYMKYIGYPFAYHTIGSCFAVSAKAYVKQGGMNRRQAGEDFYFLHKLFAAGKTVEINHATVFPSPRPSERVVFGTGPVIKRLTEKSGNTLNTYNPQAYIDIKKMLDIFPGWHEKNESQVLSDIELLPESLAQFALQNGLMEKVNEIKHNTGSKNSFVRRFYTWFTPLLIVRYLNFVHDKHYAMPSVADAAKTLLNILNSSQNKDIVIMELLKKFRQMQKAG